MICDKCGRERNDCKIINGIFICTDCLNIYKEMLLWNIGKITEIKIKPEKLYMKLGSRLDVKA